MKIGDYVFMINSAWQKHNKWMEFPDEPPTPLGVIVGKGKHFGLSVLTADSVVIEVAESDVVVSNDNN